MEAEGASHVSPDVVRVVVDEVHRS